MAMMKLCLETPRLRLRPPELTDAADWLEVCLDAQTHRYSHGKPPDDIHAVRDHIRAVRSGRDLWLSICLADGIVAIGYCGLLARPGCVELFYALHPLARGHGYAYEAARALCDPSTQLLRIEACCHPANNPSRRLLGGLGFEATSGWTGNDDVRWELSRTAQKSLARQPGSGVQSASQAPRAVESGADLANEPSRTPRMRRGYSFRP